MTGSVCSVAVDTSDLPVRCLCGCKHCCLNPELQRTVFARRELKEARPLKHKHNPQHLLVLHRQDDPQKTITDLEDFKKSLGTRKDSVCVPPIPFQLKKQIFQCDLCKGEFTRKHSLTVHLQRRMCQQSQENVNSTNRSEAECCNNLRADRIVDPCQKEHLDAADTIKLPLCKVCTEAFPSPSGLTAHKPVYSGERNLSCSLCGECFATGASLRTHGVNHRRLGAFQCALCGAVFAKKNSLSTHLRKHSGELPFTCDICGAAFNRQFTLKNHRSLHSGERPHVCAACGKAFLTRGTLTAHERTSHTGISSTRRRPQDYKPVVCEQCGKVYSNAANLRIHKRTHTGLRPFLCPVCGTAFGKKYTLQCHMRRHTNERPFSCDDCGAAFFRRSTLATHRHRHTGERPHQCKLCGQGFIQSASLVYHLEHHEHRQPSTAAQKISRGASKTC